MIQKFEEYKKMNESSISRIWRNVQNHDSGTISAFRGGENGYTKKENMKRNSVLKAKLLKMGYGVTKVKGEFIENFKTKDAHKVKEDSYIVIDLKDKGHLKQDLVELGGEFEQDSITYSTAAGDYYLISSSTNDAFPGFGKPNVSVKLGHPIFGKDGEFYSSINGRPFVFESGGQEFILEKKEGENISKIRMIHAIAEMEYPKK